MAPNVSPSPELHVPGGCERVPPVIPPSVRTLSRDPESNYLLVSPKEELRELQLKDSELKPILHWLDSQGPTPQELFREGFTTKWLWRHRDQLCLQEGVLYYLWVEPTSQHRRLVVPLCEREEVIRMSHDTRIGGHWGRDKTIRRVSQSCYWPTLSRDVGLYVVTCLVCNQQKVRRRNRAGLQDYQSGCPGERIHLDFLGPFTPSRTGNKYVLSIVDQFTKWIEVCPLPAQTSELTAQTLVERWISRFGVPHTDQGRNFESQLFQELCCHLEIRKTRTTPYRPSSNGQVERYNPQIASYVRCFLGGKADAWDQFTSLLGMSLRATVSRATGFTPNLLMLGREVTLPLDIFLGTAPASPTAPPDYVRDLLVRMSTTFASARENMKSAQWRGRQNYAESNTIREQRFQVGDLVMITNSASQVGKCKKLQPVWRGPFVVAEVLSPILYRVADRRRSKVQHVDRLRVYTDRTVPLWVQRERLKLLQVPPDEDSHYDNEFTDAFQELFHDGSLSQAGVRSPFPIVPMTGACQSASLDSDLCPPVAVTPVADVVHDTPPVMISTRNGPPPARQTRVGRQSRLPPYLRDNAVHLTNS